MEEIKKTVPNFQGYYLLEKKGEIVILVKMKIPESKGKLPHSGSEYVSYNENEK